jgi:hypothetical protein
MEEIGAVPRDITDMLIEVAGGAQLIPFIGT